jgi:hypothetical protein
VSFLDTVSFLVMGFLFSLFGCSKKDNDGGGPTRYMAELAYKDNLAKQVSMTTDRKFDSRRAGIGGLGVRG